MNKKSILERLQKKEVPVERDIVKVRVSRPVGIEITENLKDKDFNPDDFRNMLSDRNYKHEKDVNVSVFRNIKEGPSTSKISKTAKISKEGKSLIKLTKPVVLPKKKLKPEDEIVFETVHLDDIKIQTDGGLSIKDRLPKDKDVYNIKPSIYVLNNREKFSNYINTIFAEYRSQVMGQDKTTLSCDSLKSGFKGLLTHHSSIEQFHCF